MKDKIRLAIGLVFLALIITGALIRQVAIKADPLNNPIVDDPMYSYVKGKVQFKNGQPASGVSIIAGTIGTETNDRGEFKLLIGKPGSHRLYFRKGNQKYSLIDTVEPVLMVSAGEVLERNFVIGL